MKGAEKVHFFDIHPMNLMKSLSMALELTVNGMSTHHWRTALIADCIAKELKLEEIERQEVVYAALIHDIGAVSNWEERKLLRTMDDSKRIYLHAEEGYELLLLSKRFEKLAKPIRYHHDNWCGGNPSGLAGDKIPLASRIIHLADRIEVSIYPGTYIFDQKNKILDYVDEKSGTAFDPNLVDAFNQCAKSEAFWLDLINPNYKEVFFSSLDVYGSISYTLGDVTEIADIFSIIIDKTSRYTAKHSRGVAEVAAYLAKKAGFSPFEVKEMRIAGLLHDLGKLAIPNEILEKPEKLTEEEYLLIKQHTYYTYRILQGIDNFEKIAQWAAYHHETLDGTGYPFRISEDSLSLGSKILAVADVFTALTEDRPYRESLSEEKVKDIMGKMAKYRRLDKQIIDLLFEHYQDARAFI